MFTTVNHNSASERIIGAQLELVRQTWLPSQESKVYGTGCYYYPVQTR